MPLTLTPLVKILLLMRVLKVVSRSNWLKRLTAPSRGYLPNFPGRFRAVFSPVSFGVVPIFGVTSQAVVGHMQLEQTLGRETFGHETPRPFPNTRARRRGKSELVCF